MPGGGPLAGARTRTGAGEAVLGVEAELVVHLPLLGVAEDVVGFLNVLEALLGGFVAGVEVGMVLARQLAVGLADIVRGGLARHPEGFVIIVLGSGRHIKGLWGQGSGVRESGERNQSRASPIPDPESLIPTSCRLRRRTRRRLRRGLSCRHRHRRRRTGAACRRAGRWGRRPCTWLRPACGWRW